MRLTGFGGGCYSPEPAFWSAALPAVAVQPPLAAAGEVVIEGGIGFSLMTPVISTSVVTILPGTVPGLPPGTVSVIAFTVPSFVEGPAGDPSCSDGLDNDGDGLTDGNDPGCAPATTTTSTTSTTTSSTSSSTTSTSTTSTSTTSTSTSTTSTSTSSTTTTTLTTPQCSDEATFISIDCRLHALRDGVDASSDLGSSKAAVRLLVVRAIESLEEAEVRVGQGNPRRAALLLRSTGRRLKTFNRRLNSNHGRSTIPEASRKTFSDAAQAILDDVDALRATF